MRASTEKVSFFGGGGRGGGDGWPHLKHKKSKKLRKTCIRGRDIEKLFEKSQKHKDLYASFFVFLFFW